MMHSIGLKKSHNVTNTDSPVQKKSFDDLKLSKYAVHLFDIRRCKSKRRRWPIVPMSDALWSISDALLPFSDALWSTHYLIN